LRRNGFLHQPVAPQRFFTLTCCATTVFYMILLYCNRLQN